MIGRVLYFSGQLAVPCADYRAADGCGQGNEVSLDGQRALLKKGRRNG